MLGFLKAKALCRKPINASASSVHPRAVSTVLQAHQSQLCEIARIDGFQHREPCKLGFRTMRKKLATHLEVGQCDIMCASPTATEVSDGCAMCMEVVANHFLSRLVKIRFFC